MKKVRKTLILLGVCACLLSSPVFADPTESTTEESSEETESTTEELIPAEPEVIPEVIHGETYNSSEETYPVQGDVWVKSVTDQIQNAYNEYYNRSSAQESKLKDEEIAEIKQIRYLYNALPMAQKARVKNEEQLFAIEQKWGITYDYADVYRTEASEDILLDTQIKGIYYSFELNDSVQKTSISLRYLTDMNMDGTKEVPSITITKPDGSKIELSQKNAEIREAELHVLSTWQADFMQIDFANGVYGTWGITTDLPVIFTQIDYAGAEQPMEANTSTEAVTETKIDGEEETESEGNPWLRLSLFGIGIFILFFLLSRSGKKTKQPKKSQKTEDVERIIKSEDDIARTKEALKMVLADEDFSDYTDEPELEPAVENTQDMMEIPLQEDIETMGDDSGVLIWNKDVPQQHTEQQTQSAQPAVVTDDDDDDDFLDNF